MVRIGLNLTPFLPQIARKLIHHKKVGFNTKPNPARALSKVKHVNLVLEAHVDFLLPCCRIHLHESRLVKEKDGAEKSTDKTTVEDKGPK